MLTKLIIGGALLTAGLSGGVWAIANKKTENCCYPGADCCYPGSPCCEDCCYPGSPCCYPGSPCCDDAAKAAKANTGAKKGNCCSSPICPPGCDPDCLPNCCDGDKAKVTPKTVGEAKCVGGACADAGEGN
jgi:hypothetical protein